MKFNYSLLLISTASLLIGCSRIDATKKISPNVTEYSSTQGSRNENISSDNFSQILSLIPGRDYNNLSSLNEIDESILYFKYRDQIKLVLKQDEHQTEARMNYYPWKRTRKVDCNSTSNTNRQHIRTPFTYSSSNNFINQQNYLEKTQFINLEVIRDHVTSCSNTITTTEAIVDLNPNRFMDQNSYTKSGISYFKESLHNNYLKNYTFISKSSDGNLHKLTLIHVIFNELAKDLVQVIRQEFLGINQNLDQDQHRLLVAQVTASYPGFESVLESKLYGTPIRNNAQARRNITGTWAPISVSINGHQEQVDFSRLSALSLSPRSVDKLADNAASSRLRLQRRTFIDSRNKTTYSFINSNRIKSTIEVESETQLSRNIFPNLQRGDSVEIEYIRID